MGLKQKIIVSGMVLLLSLASLVINWTVDEGGSERGGFWGRSRMGAGLALIFGEEIWMILALLSGSSFIFFLLKYFNAL